MKWRLTVFCMIIFAGVSYGLYQLSYEVQRLEGSLSSLKSGISQNREAIKILGAEWAYQNRPEMLQELASKHLPLLLIAPYQVASVADLPDALEDGGGLAVPTPRQRPERRFAKAPEINSKNVHLASYVKSPSVRRGVK